ncbi:hypothetical protein ACFL1I_04275 [Candidatus Omnitrophota bacterium]
MMRSRKLIILLIIVLFAALQGSLLELVRIFNVKPDLLLILVVFFSLYFGRTYGLGCGALCGFFTELTSSPVCQGAVLFTYSLLGLILGSIAKWVYLHPVRNKGLFNQAAVSQIAITFIFTFLAYLFLALFFGMRQMELLLPQAMLYVILPAACYTASLAPIIFSCLETVLNVK